MKGRIPLCLLQIIQFFRIYWRKHTVFAAQNIVKIMQITAAQWGLKIAAAAQEIQPQDLSVKGQTENCGKVG